MTTPSRHAADPSKLDEELFVVGTNHKAKEAVRAPNLEANYPFLLFARPDRVTLMGTKVIPFLRTVPIQAGFLGTKTRRQGDGKPEKVLHQGMVDAMRNKGWTLVEQEWAPNGTSYIKRVPVAGGFHYMSTFATPHPGTNRVTVDEQAYADWASSLVADGKIEAPATFALEALLEQVERESLRTADKAVTTPSLAPRAKLLADQVQALRDALDGVGPAEAETFVVDNLPDDTPEADPEPATKKPTRRSAKPAG